MFGSLRNLCQLLIYLPENEDVRVFRTRGEAMLAERQALGTSRKDIFSHLLIADTTTGRAFTQKQLDSTANLIIVAGSDTTSTTLTQLFRLLAVDAHTQKGRKEESVYKKLQKEIDSLYEGEGNLSIENVRNAKYLNAVINEALRLCNPIPSGAQAATPPQGIEFAGLHIPGNINVWVPHLGLMTDERYFPSGTDFIPERWTGEQPELLNEFSSKAFIPFGYGMHNCVGKQLALNEMRIVVARIVRDFDVLLGESYNEEQFDSEWKDHIAVKLGALWLKFLPRETPKPA
jgi:cytochrome P450